MCIKTVYNLLLLFYCLHFQKFKPVITNGERKGLSRSELQSIVFTKYAFSIIRNLNIAHYLHLNIVFLSYKLEMNDIQTVTGSTLGSTLPLVKLPRDEEASDYNPFEHRKVTHPTT